jgi:hypothetical protein
MMRSVTKAALLYISLSDSQRWSLSGHNEHDM